MKMILIILALCLLGIILPLVVRLNINKRKKQRNAANRDKNRQIVRGHYQVIVKEGKQVGVKFDNTGQKEYFFNDN